MRGEAKIRSGKSGIAEDAHALMHMTVGFWISQAIYSAAQLNIADHLQAAPLTTSNLAKALNGDEAYVFRLMRALAGIGLFRENPDSTFELTSQSQLLRSDHPQSMLPAILMLGDENYRAWGHLAEAVQSGGIPFEKAYGLQAYEFYRQNPLLGKRFNDAMGALNRQDVLAIAEAYDFGAFKTIADIGGGNGTLLVTILKHHPSLSGLLFDLPQVANEAAEFLTKEGMAERCRFVAGDFFKTVTPGADAYILAHIMHTFNDDLCLQILRNVRQAMPDNGRLLVIEEILQPGNDPATAKTKFMDLNMLVLTDGGREHTQAEFEALFQAAGFRLSGITPTPSGTCVIEAIKLA